MEGQEINSHDKAFAIIPKVGGILSIIGCVLILRDVFLKVKKHKTIPLTAKIMTLITVANLFIAFWENFLSTWMVPKDSGAFMASGNVRTCNLQAFISVLMYMIVETAYTMLSALYYITVVRRDWTTQRTRSLTVVFSFLGLPIIIGLSTAVPLLAAHQYNFDGLYSCNIAAYPLHCWHNNVPCTRAPNASYIRGWLYIYVLACFAFIIIFLSVLMYNVKKQEAELAKQSSCDYLQGIRGQGGLSNPIVGSCWRYLTVFFIPNLALMIWGVIDISGINLSDTGWRFVDYLYVILWPMFGALNGLVYFRLRYLHEKKSSPEATWTSLLGKALSIPSVIKPSTANETLPPPMSSLNDHYDLYTPLFEDDNATGSNNEVL
eukprot:scaffold747_cov145-Skeletonema_menzelii.AAC.22